MCAFCEIVRRATPAHVVSEDELTLAFLDARPVFEGHTLLVPKAHHETLGDLPDELIAPLFTNARTLSRAIVEAMDATGTFVAINNKVSQSVPHLHVHVVPRRPKDGLRGFFWPRSKYASDGAMRAVAEAIRAAV